ncbi:MAG: 50S ribosome-binding GTPase, partial [Eggerthellaceae bacterium]|nr:50S ribosome-binding GTPase [Eggerthellaceae bacterium]
MPQTKHSQVAQSAQETITLDTLPLHARARIVCVEGEASLRQHLLDMGLVPGAVIEPIKRAPFGDPIEFRIRNYQLTLRVAEASLVHVTQILEDELSEDYKPLYSVQQASKAQALSHPKLGESRGLGTYKKTAATHDDKPLTFVLVGNQNSGKTTLFNQLTGARQRVGNFPGVTIEYKEATLKGTYDAIIDLPGLYSLSPYSNEEVIARSYIFENNPSAIINVVDATNIERNLYLTMQLMELGIPVVVALNMMDEVQKNGATININLIEDLLGVPVVPISALHGEGVAELVDHAKYIARHNIVPRVQDFCSRDDFGGAVHTCIHSV